MASFERIAPSILTASSRAGTMTDTVGHWAGSWSKAVALRSVRPSVITREGATPATQRTNSNQPATQTTCHITRSPLIPERARSQVSGSYPLGERAEPEPRGVIGADQVDIRLRRNSVLQAHRPVAGVDDEPPQSLALQI